MKLNECTKGLLLKTKSGELVEVQTVQFNRLKAKVLFPLSKTPVFKEYGADLVAVMQEASPELVAKYEKAVADRRAKGKGKNSR